MKVELSRVVHRRILAMELKRQHVGSRSLTAGSDDLDARGRSPMCHRRIWPSLGGEAGGRSPGFVSGEPAQSLLAASNLPSGTKRVVFCGVIAPRCDQMAEPLPWPPVDAVIVLAGI
jgi:hypothetical protein